MARYNRRFELDVEDIDRIESALRASQSDADVDTAREIQDLLGRLHQQKVFYRPKTGTYISG